MQSITTRPAPAQEPAPEPGVFSSPLFVRIHLALTALLTASLLALGVLAAAGLLHVGKQAAAAETEEAAEPAQPEKKKSQEAEGRYQIEPADDARRVLLETGKLGGMLDSRVREAWVYRYQGGFLETTLETDAGGAPLFSATMPGAKEWGRFLVEQGVKPNAPDALNKEGRLILVGLVTPVSVEQALQPLHVHLGAAFTSGPGGPLHTLLPYYFDVERLIEYRLFLAVGPAKGKTGPGFTLWNNPWLPIRSHLVNEPTADHQPHVTSSKNLEAGKDLTILERPLGKSTVRLKVRFLTDAEAVEKAKAE